MKLSILIIAVSASLLVTAREIVVGSQATSPFLDTEVSTNVAICVARNDVRFFEVRMDLECCESNCVQVAFGFDLNNDNDLSFDETELVLGRRNGRCFVEDAIGGVRHFDGLAPSFGTGRFLQMQIVTNREYVPKSAVFTSDAGTCFDAIAAECPPWLFHANWNLLKVTRRGIGTSNESFHINRISHSFHVIFK